MQKYVLSAPYRKIAYELNIAYDESKREKITNNTLREFESTLETFYETHGLKVSNPHHITMQKQMTEEQVEELADIVDTFTQKALEERDFYFGDIIADLSPEELQAIKDKQQREYLESGEITETNMSEFIRDLDIPWDEFNVDKYKQIKDKYGVETVQQFVDWTDEMERYRSSAFLQEVLTSDQIAELYSYAQSGDVKVSRRSMHAMIRAQYNKNGYTGTDLYNVIIDKIKAKKGK